MENAIDALKMAFAMLVFVMALGLGIHTLGLARETADIMLTLADPPHTAGFRDATENRVRTVGLETIIPSLYKYYKEDYMVVFQRKVGEIYKPMKIYETQTNPVLWSHSYAKLWNGGYKEEVDLRYDDNNGKTIACFDVEAETARKEPWTASADIYFKQNLDCILYGGVFDYPDGSGRFYDYSELKHVGSGGLIKKLQGKRFEEHIGENYYEIDNEYSQMKTTKTKRVIIYREVN